jgi:hypothetical protein
MKLLAAHVLWAETLARPNKYSLHNKKKAFASLRGPNTYIWTSCYVVRFYEALEGGRWNNCIRSLTLELGNLVLFRSASVVDSPKKKPNRSEEALTASWFGVTSSK